MDEDTNAECITVADRGEELDVPTVMDITDLDTWYGDVPDTIRFDRIFRYDDVVRGEMFVPGGIVEVGYWRDEDYGSRVGWVGEFIDGEFEPNPIGETLWIRE